MSRLPERFFLGSHLCREPMPPMTELKHDMELLKKNGFNLVKLQEHWMIDEPREGEHDFSRYEELIEHAAGLDLGVYLGLTCEQAPHWLYEKHPDCRMVRRDGTRVAYEATTTLPADGKPGPCFDHPGAMADQLRFITRLVETLGRYENIVVWNTWQEIAYWAESLVGGHVCYCPHTVAAWQAWLRERYGDLDALNRAWRTRYADWTAIQPERLAALEPVPQEFLWRAFMDTDQLAGVLRARAAAIRAADPHRRPIFAHKGAPALATIRDWTFAAAQDFLGSSYYPAWGSGMPWDDGRQGSVTRDFALPAEMFDGVAYRTDHLRAANGPATPVWAAEFQGGPVSTRMHLGRTPDAADIRRWLLTVVGSGATAVSFWVTRAEIMAHEVNGFGLLDSAGDSSERFAEAGRVGRALQRFPDLFAANDTVPQAEVAIALGDANGRFCETFGDAMQHLAYSVRNWYRLLTGAGIPVDLVPLATVGEMACRTAIVPLPLCLSAAEERALTSFVDRGGNLVCEACPGRFDEYAFATRGEMPESLCQCFGVRHTGLTMVREPDHGTRWSPRERTWGEYAEAAMLTGVGPLAGHSLRASVYLQSFAVADAEPVLMWGDRVVAARRGRAWLLGTVAGHGVMAYRDPATTACLLAIVAATGVGPTHTGKLLVRRRVAGQRQAWFVTNPTAAAVTGTLALPAGGSVEDLLGEPFGRGNDGVTITIEPYDVRVLIHQAE